VLVSEETFPRDQRPIVAVIYHMFPHYRAGVMRALSESKKFEFRFWGSHKPVSGIPAFSGDQEVKVNELTFTPTRAGGHFSGLYQAVWQRDTSCVVLIGNPNYIQTWIAALLAKALGKKVFFWAHGWLKKENAVKAALRNTYFNLADGVLVYGDRAGELAEETGFPKKKIHAVYNSLDFQRNESIFSSLEEKYKTPASIRQGRENITAWPDLPTFICTARLTPICRFDLLLEAMAILERKGTPCSLLLVGDGPERSRLESLAAKLDVKVSFLGAIYDEDALAPLIYLGDVTISPGKVGLTAMHSLGYGTPVITHGDMDAQMPEVEAIIPGENGEVFRVGDVEDLAETIVKWLSANRDRADLRKKCRAPIIDRYNPVAQRELIEAALQTVMKP
jgi:glycosyltransferase involved in cell wall biosynthesis